MSRLLEAFARGVCLLVIALAGVMLVSLTLQIGARFLFNQALSWTEELALGCFSWCMLLALALGVRDAIHARIDFLTGQFPATFGRTVHVGVHAAIALLGAFVAWHGVRYTVDSFGTTSAAIGYPIAWLYAAAPACGLCLIVFALERAVVGAPAPVAEV